MTDVNALTAWIRTILTLAALVWTATKMADDYFDSRRK